MRLGEWYNIVYVAAGQEVNFWLLPLKNGPEYVACIEVPRGGIRSQIFTSEFVDKYGKRKKKPEDIKVNYKTARNAMKAIF